jgi:putative transcriptional regulator
MDERVSNAIKEYRRNAGLTQEDLAGAMGVSRQTIISIERGRYIPSLPLALKMAGYFKCSVGELFRLEEVDDHGR